MALPSLVRETLYCMYFDFFRASPQAWCKLQSFKDGDLLFLVTLILKEKVSSIPLPPQIFIDIKISDLTNSNLYQTDLSLENNFEHVLFQKIIHQ